MRAQRLIERRNQRLGEQVQSRSDSLGATGRTCSACAFATVLFAVSLRTTTAGWRRSNRTPLLAGSAVR